MITVRELLSDKSFSGFIVLAGEAGLDKRQINTLCVIDTPDLSGWVLGNEFFISSGYIFKDDPAKLLSIIETAAKNGAAALGIKTGRFTGRLPREVINLANKLDFPLIDIPNHYNHTEIINPTLTKIISKQAAMLDFSEKVRGVFFDIVLQESNITDILDKLSDFLACDVGFADISSGERYASGSRDFASVFGSMPLPKLFEVYYCESVHTGSKRYGYIVLKSENRGERVIDDNVPMTHAKTTLLIQLQKESAKREVEKRYVNEFVQDIFLRRFRNTREILDRGKNFKWNLEVPQVALAFEVADKPGGNPIGQKVFYQCVSLLACHYRSIPNTEMRGQLICLLPIKTTWPAEKSMLIKIISEIQENIAQTFSLDLCVGVGSPKEDILFCDESEQEAHKALEVALSPDGVQKLVFWDDLGIYKLLSLINNNPDTNAFIEEQLAPLLCADRENGSSRLFETLAAISQSGWQLKTAAETLGLHYNTIKYRFNQICELCGGTIDGQKQLSLSLAIELYMINRKKD